jgi:hypothetical protein
MNNKDIIFTEAELAHFASVMETPIAQKSPIIRLGKGNEDERGIGDTVAGNTLTDESGKSWKVRKRNANIRK